MASRCRATPPWRVSFRSACLAALAALAVAHDKYGEPPWRNCSSRHCARPRRFSDLAASLRSRRGRSAKLCAGRARLFLRCTSRPWPVAYKLANPALADTFETIARDGAKAFYQGDIAKVSRARGKTTRASRASPPRGTSRSIGPSSASRSARPILPDKVCGMGRRPPAALPWRRLGIIDPFDLGPDAGRRADACHRESEARLALRLSARVSSPIWISFRSRSPGCSIRVTSGRTPRLDQSGRSRRTSPPARRRT